MVLILVGDSTVRGLFYSLVGAATRSSKSLVDVFAVTAPESGHFDDTSRPWTPRASRSCWVIAAGSS